MCSSLTLTYIYISKVVSKIGQNVQAFIARENELKDMQDSVAQTRAKEIYSVWEQTGMMTQQRSMGMSCF